MYGHSNYQNDHINNGTTGNLLIFIVLMTLYSARFGPMKLYTDLLKHA